MSYSVGQGSHKGFLGGINMRGQLAFSKDSGLSRQSRLALPSSAKEKPHGCPRLLQADCPLLWASGTQLLLPPLDSAGFPELMGFAVFRTVIDALPGVDVELSPLSPQGDFCSLNWKSV